MDTIKRIFNTIFALMLIAVALNFWLSFNEGPKKSNAGAVSKPPQPTEAPKPPPFKPTPAMLAALDPGEEFHRDGWLFEYGELTKNGVDVWVYWPKNQPVSIPLVESMGKAMVADTVKRLSAAGFEAKNTAANITYYFRQDAGNDLVIMLGSAGYMGILDQYYYTPPAK